MTQTPLAELAHRIAAHARPEMTTAIDGLLVASVTDTSPEYSLTDPLLWGLIRKSDPDRPVLHNLYSIRAKFTPLSDDYLPKGRLLPAGA